MPCAVVASPLLRAMQTAQPAAGRAGLDVATDEHLLDRDYGQWTEVLRQDVIDHARTRRLDGEAC